MKKFTDYPLHPQIIATLDTLGYTSPTEIQAQTLPILLERGTRDFHGQAQTGTGKTLAFGIPLLHHIDASTKKPQVLIVGPTRELVVQIYDSLKVFAQPMGISIAPIYGGVSIDRQLNDLRHGVQIIIGTPGRLRDHLRRKSLKLDAIHTIVLDEADIMLDMGFKEEVDEILEYINPERNIWLFSATVKPGIEDIKRTHMKNPRCVQVSRQSLSNLNTQQYYCIVPEKNRLDALCRFIMTTPSFYGFVFCQTKLQTSKLAEKLAAKGYSANALHGDMNQANRNRVITDFKRKKFSILVATDVAARGIDVQDATHVFNYKLPDDHEGYIHRIGRTGRAGKQGIAITFLAKKEMYQLNGLIKRFKLPINEISVPSLDQITDQQAQKAKEFLTSISQKSHDQDNYSKALHGAVESLSTDELNNALIALLSEKFFKTIQADTFNSSDLSDSHHGDGERDGNFTELFINVGIQDGITREDIFKHLTHNKTLNRNHIAKVRVIKKRSFVLVPSMEANNIMTKLEQQQLKGRRWRVFTE
jgi:ATP-dependent RNA helicase DeaD